MSLTIKGSYIAAQQVAYTTGKGEIGHITKFWCDIDKDSPFPSMAEFQFFGDKLNVSNLKKGDEIEVSFNISGRKWEKDGRKGFIQSLNAWKIEQAAQRPAPMPQSAPAFVGATPEQSKPDDLPF